MINFLQGTLRRTTSRDSHIYFSIEECGRTRSKGGKDNEVTKQNSTPNIKVQFLIFSDLICVMRNTLANLTNNLDTRYTLEHRIRAAVGAAILTSL